MKKRDGGSKDNDSYMSRVMCLISLRNWRNERGGGGAGALSTPQCNEKHKDFAPNAAAVNHGSTFPFCQ